MLPETPATLQSDIDPPNFHVAEIHHGPAELIGSRHGDNFIGHLIIISIRLKFDPFQSPTYKLPGISQADIVLGCKFRVEVGISDKSVIQIIERRHSENSFVESPDIQLLRTERLPGNSNRRRIFLLVTGCSISDPGGFVDKGP